MGTPCRESSGTADWAEANRRLRERLQARDGNLLEVIRNGEALSFGEWADSFLKNFSKPPTRAAKTHAVNIRCITHLKAAFASRNWWSSQPTQSKNTFAIGWNSGFA